MTERQTVSSSHFDDNKMMAAASFRVEGVSQGKSLVKALYHYQNNAKKRTNDLSIGQKKSLALNMRNSHDEYEVVDDDFFEKLEKIKCSITLFRGCLATDFSLGVLASKLDSYCRLYISCPSAISHKMKILEGKTDKLNEFTFKYCDNFTPGDPNTLPRNRNGVPPVLRITDTPGSCQDNVYNMICGLAPTNSAENSLTFTRLYLQRCSLSASEANKLVEKLSYKDFTTHNKRVITAAKVSYGRNENCYVCRANHNEENITCYDLRLAKSDYLHHLDSICTANFSETAIKRVEPALKEVTAFEVTNTDHLFALIKVLTYSQQSSAHSSGVDGDETKSVEKDGKTKQIRILLFDSYHNFKPLSDGIFQDLQSVRCNIVYFIGCIDSTCSLNVLKSKLTEKSDVRISSSVTNHHLNILNGVETEYVMDFTFKYCDNFTPDEQNPLPRNRNGLRPVLRITDTPGSCQDNVYNMICGLAPTNSAEDSLTFSHLYMPRCSLSASDAEKLVEKLNAKDFTTENNEATRAHKLSCGRNEYCYICSANHNKKNITCYDLELSKYFPLHRAAEKGDLEEVRRLIDQKVKINRLNGRGETALFVAIKHNQLECVQVLLNADCELNIVDNRGWSALHIAVEMGYLNMLDILLTKGKSDVKNIDINKCDKNGYTPAYYAIKASRYDILQRYLEHKDHVNATDRKTLLQFITERNNLGQLNNALVRVLESEKNLHDNKSSALICLKEQLGTTEASTNARSQLLAMYESSSAQRHFWNFCSILSCFVVPFILYFLDVSSDVLLAFEYYNGFQKTTANNNLFDGANVNSTVYGNFREEDEKTWNQDKTNFMLTVSFIVFPYVLLYLWSFYIHFTQQHILPISNKIRIVLYVLVPPPIIVYIENTYAQINHMNVTTKQKTRFQRPQTDDETIYTDNHLAQMRVAITNVMEATLESAFQLILQLYIVATQYNDLVKVQDVTIGSILTSSSDGSTTRLAKQIFSLIFSLVTLTWSFTSYHRFFKLDGLTILNALPLLLAIFFQVVSRAIACTIFTLVYSWGIFVVLGVHFLIVFELKLRLEERSLIPDSEKTKYNRRFIKFEHYFYVLLGTISSTLVYFRIERPSLEKTQNSRRHSTVAIQVLFLMLSCVENIFLLSLGLAGLDREIYDSTFMVATGVTCALSYIIGVGLHSVYYRLFGHPWTDINGPEIERDEEKGLIVSYYRKGEMKKLSVSLNTCCEVTHTEEEEPNDETAMELLRRN